MRNDFKDQTWLETALASTRNLRVAVLGDFCLDAYWQLDTDETELSIETGLPVRRVRRQRYSPGGAGNVVANLIDLGAQRVQAIGVVGTDLFGTELLRMLDDRGAEIGDTMIVDERWQTMVYAKPCRGGEEESRIDFGAFNALTESIVEALIAALERAISENDVVILNQQISRGVSSASMIERINPVIAAHPETQFVVDARHRASHYRGAVLKLNIQEAVRFLNDPMEALVAAERAKDLVRRISQATGKAAFLTRGEHGILVAEGDVVLEVPGIQVMERTDPVGAGDTVVAAIAAALGSGNDTWTAARLANIAASITVRKLQTTGTATPAEIVAVGADPDYIFEPELADAPRLARYVEGTEIERIGELPRDLAIEHCIFDHDGTLSTLREGWEKIMEPMMVRSVLGPEYDRADNALFDKVTKEVRGFIDRTTGIQTLVQMKGLVELVRQAGFVEESQILDEHGYKHIFNQDLLKMIGKRMKKLRSGELDPVDFQMKNAMLLLQELHRRGIKLYLASGTDEVDVIAEADAMGYADLFEGRVFGGVGDINIEAKKMVLDRIIEENHLAGVKLATIGDGPVEMRETRKCGGFPIGIASDEVRRFGWNMAKRSRLIRAGARVIVPDFSQLPALLRVMRLEL